jgi:hypothetical protein
MLVKLGLLYLRNPVDGVTGLVALLCPHLVSVNSCSGSRIAVLTLSAPHASTTVSTVSKHRATLSHDVPLSLGATNQSLIAL